MEDNDYKESIEYALGLSQEKADKLHSYIESMLENEDDRYSDIVKKVINKNDLDITEKVLAVFLIGRSIGHQEGHECAESLAANPLGILLEKLSEEQRHRKRSTFMGKGGNA